ncbi:hypothetical protein BJY21_001094 [Kineosphaera limosa]|uniref:DUF4188 domain-containing protein n=1 Tax=Kineosphaera limosa NBRC 100340 TaxID=1184609 RepID=K6X9P0_9MICO|nr:hypothetical protein [Kineosphaera limosa]NYD99909.1 hypothetical protein [Kineosphaera limosa]GAB95554.1 hypothetical protein KILIM_022_00390 [Kineosphaera limosa NBRC 100340]
MAERGLFGLADSDAVFVGASRYRGPHSWAVLAPRWRRMTAQMARLPGYRTHRVYYALPFTLGTIGAFARLDDLLRFARSGEHRALMEWVTDGTRNASGGYIRIFRSIPTAGDAPEVEGLSSVPRPVTGSAGAAGAAGTAGVADAHD